MIMCSVINSIWSQSIIINNQNNQNSSASSVFQINGISSSQDIGGTEISIKEFYPNLSGEWVDAAFKQLHVLHYYNFYLVIKNYNPFMVTTLVAVDIKNNRGYTNPGQTVLSGVISANGIKVFDLGHSKTSNTSSVIGSITRKMSK